MKFKKEELKTRKEEGTEEDSIKKKKALVWRTIIALVLVIVAFQMMSHSISERGNNNKKEEEQEEVSKQNMEDVNRVINNAINSENQTSITDDSQENNISEESPSEEISATSELQINGLNEEVIQYTGNNQERMKNEIRTWLNSYGFAEETAVTFYGECLIDYNTENVTISFTLDSTPNIGIDYIYNRKNDSVSVAPW